MRGCFRWSRKSRVRALLVVLLVGAAAFYSVSPTTTLTTLLPGAKPLHKTNDDTLQPHGKPSNELDPRQRQQRAPGVLPKEEDDDDSIRRAAALLPEDENQSPSQRKTLLRSSPELRRALEQDLERLREQREIDRETEIQREKDEEAKPAKILPSTRAPTFGPDKDDLHADMEEETSSDAVAHISAVHELVLGAQREALCDPLPQQQQSKLPAVVPPQTANLARSPNPARILLYATIAATTADASGIWLSDTLDTLSRLPQAEVYLLLHTQPKPDADVANQPLTIIQSLQHVTVINPWLEADAQSMGLAPVTFKSKLDSNNALQWITALDHQLRFDHLLIRSIPVAALVSRYADMAHRLWAFILPPTPFPALNAPLPAVYTKLKQLLSTPARGIFSTERARLFVQDAVTVPALKPSSIVPTVVPPFSPSADVTAQTHQLIHGAARYSTAKAAGFKICYQGRADNEYLFAEMLQAYKKSLGGSSPASMSMMLIISNYEQPELLSQTQEFVRNEPSVVLFEQLSRATTLALLQDFQCSVGVRLMSNDAGLEVSTKFLEYSLLGVPTVMTVPSASAEDALEGMDYPEYLTVLLDGSPASSESFVARLANAFVTASARLAESPSSLANLQQRLRSLAALHSPDATVARYQQLLTPRPRHGYQAQPVDGVPPSSCNILMVAHDFKLMGDILEHFSSASCTVRKITWTPQSLLAMDQSGELIKHAQWAGTIWCEFALDQAHWFASQRSKYDPSHDKTLIVRIHGPELQQPIADKIQWAQVDHVITTAPYFYNECLVRMPQSTPIHLISNIMWPLTLASNPIKSSSSRATALGLIVSDDSPKALEMAIDILREIRDITGQANSNWTLVVAGPAPATLEWTPSSPVNTEREYLTQARQILASLGLEAFVQFVGAPADPSVWLHQVGFILSTSDSAADVHMVSEGMATGCIPVVRRGFGADLMYPAAYSFDGPVEAATLIKAHAEQSSLRIANQRAASVQEAQARFEGRAMLRMLDELVLPLENADSAPTDLQTLQPPESQNTAALLQLSPSSIVKTHMPSWTSRSKLVIMAIMDEFTAGCYQHEARIVKADIDNWRGQLANAHPQLLIVESIWQGPWAEHVMSDSAWGNPVVELLKQARLRGIPSLFWNKEDPAHFHEFSHSAFLPFVDAVFTTEEAVVPAYAKILGHDRIFASPFAASPRTHSPVGSYRPRNKGYAFAGTYAFQTRYPHRKGDLDLIFAAAKTRGLAIFQRSEGVSRHIVPWGAELQPHLKGSQPYVKMVKLYNKYEVFINANSVNVSKTMCSRRPFEVVSTGTPVVSNPGPALKIMLGHSVVIVHSAAEMNVAAARFDNPLIRERLALSGQRRVFAAHTYGHRLRAMIEQMTFDNATLAQTPDPAPSATVAVCLPLVPSSCDAAARCVPRLLSDALETYQRMVFGRGSYELLIGVVLPPANGGHPCADPDSAIRAVRDALEQMLRQSRSERPVTFRVFATSGASTAATVGACMHQAIDLAERQHLFFLDPSRHYYGPNFLRDLLPAFSYTDAQVVGKSSVYAVDESARPSRPFCASANSAGVLQAKYAHGYNPDLVNAPAVGLTLHNPTAQLEYVDKLAAAPSAIFSVDFLRKCPLDSLSHAANPLDHLLAIALEARAIFFSGNRHNFIFDAVSRASADGCSSANEAITPDMISFTSW
ncbi:hypothetical protein CAOG_04464 [Capsaspora owczarzaki ATCC 30864]|uniref:Spore protein YkvP/CgeB glycosyl transferase-like domain-containing protein n=1 Tax=Capsaspora owczarzaki (strain ATCC 30864) TaxID=595528 RepID=A0A0D2UF39_CAPO3|nr:hypothetical protein CAOG_04464 [Capsaspora owczarzaki ATCC 30864]KJE93711.1 hypothetical protein CAOG_004464 [Capsaspora owczarzaki ATCC 30864]|eukprot:XP_004348292.1 hypothetical protein CAOG_04464 [Capsaspora owczarzaki ATCC 30864]